MNLIVTRVDDVNDIVDVAEPTTGLRLKYEYNLYECEECGNDTHADYTLKEANDPKVFEALRDFIPHDYLFEGKHKCFLLDIESELEHMRGLNKC